MNERKVISIIAALNGAAALFVISLAAWMSGMPLLFPALGPSAFIMFTRPFSPAAAPRSVILSHTTALGCGWCALFLTSQATGATITMMQPNLALCASANLGFAATCSLLVAQRCSHPPACATALIAATGGVVGWAGALAMLIAVVVLAFQGVLLHRAFGVRVPVWKADQRNDPTLESHRKAA
ncbi:MAG: HPP family protein [Phycisphaerales bacterium]|nr:HPP family protein [Phycisphaerales bacterium]